MTSGTIRPTGSTNSGCTITGAATAHEAVDEVTLDTADYALFDSVGDYINLTFPAISGNAGDTVVAEVTFVGQAITAGASDCAVTVSDSSGYSLGVKTFTLASASATTLHLAFTITTGDKLATGWKVQIRKSTSSYNFKIYQVFVRYKFCATASLATVAIRPDADLTHGFTCSAGSTEWSLIDEATADDADYIYSAANCTSKWSLAVPSHSGKFLYLKLTLRHNASVSMTANNYLRLYDAAGNDLAYPTGAAWLLIGLGSYTTWSQTTVTPGGVKSTGELMEWADIDNGAVQDETVISGGTFYISQVFVTAYYEQTDYWDDSVPVVLPVTGYGFQTKVTLGAACPVISKMQIQVSTDVSFATTDYDSGELDSSADANDVLSVISSHTFTTAGTYYIRVGARDTSDTQMTWSLVGSFVVNFPSITSQTVSHISEERYRVTVVVSDDYADPPEVSVTVDGQTGPARLQ